MTSQTVNLLDIQQLCRQRSRRQLLNVPFARMEIVSPYPAFTKSQLDMRRKIEVLKYSASSSNSKTNNLTRAELFAQLVRGSEQRRNFSQTNLQNMVNGTEVCPSDDFIPGSTAAADVPGPIEYLQYDPAVPLYNSNTSVMIQSSQNAGNNLDSPFVLIPYNDVQTLSGQESGNVCTLRTYAILENNVLNATFNTPISISAGNITTCLVYIYYNDTLVTTNDSSRTITPTTPSISLNSVPVVTTTTNMITTTVRLFAQPGFLYDIRFKIQLSNSIGTVRFNV